MTEIYDGGKDISDKLHDLLLRYEDLMNELNEPSVVNDQERFR